MEWHAVRRTGADLSPVGARLNRIDALYRRAQRCRDLEAAESRNLRPWLATHPAWPDGYPRARIYTLVAALCAEGVAPELDLLPLPESPDVAALAHLLLAAWRRGAPRYVCGFADEITYVTAVRSWLRACDRTDRWQRAFRLLSHLESLRRPA